MRELTMLEVGAVFGGKVDTSEWLPNTPDPGPSNGDSPFNPLNNVGPGDPFDPSK
jgi:hypothetical protein